MRIPGSIPPGNDIHIMHCPSLVVKCFFAFHRFLQKGHDFVISFVRIDESAEAYVRFSPEFPVFVGKPVLYWAVFSMGTHFCMKSYVKLHKRCFADTVPPNASGAADSSAPPVLSVRDAFQRGAITGKSRAGDNPHGFLGSTAQFGKKSQTGFLPQFKVWKTKESCMYFWFFKLKKWGKKTAETRRRNCAVLPLIYSVSPLVMARMVFLVAFSSKRRTLCFTPSP